jgi:hypothetical protein
MGLLVAALLVAPVAAAEDVQLAATHGSPSSMAPFLLLAAAGGLGVWIQKDQKGLAENAEAAEDSDDDGDSDSITSDDEDAEEDISDAAIEHARLEFKASSCREYESAMDAAYDDLFAQLLAGGGHDERRSQ